MGTFSGIKIERKNILQEQLLNQQYENQSLNQFGNDQSFQTEKNHPLPPVQDPYEDIVMNEFRSNVVITINGQQIDKSGYYNDFQNNVPSGIHQAEHIQPTTEYVEQVDPSSFFGNSMGGVIEKFKR